MLAAQGGGERETGRGPDAVVGLLIPDNSVASPGAPARITEWGEQTPDRSVELRRAVSASSQPPLHPKEGREP
jgi:hypothetical protein